MKPRIDRLISAGIEAAVAFDETVTLACGFEAGVIERTMAQRECAEQAIKKEKTDSKVGVHAAVFVDGVMMNVVQTTGGQKPAAEERVLRHPETGEVHTVMQIVEGENGPGDERS